MCCWIYKKPNKWCGEYDNNPKSYYFICDILSLISKLFLAWYLYGGIKNVDFTPTLAPTTPFIPNYIVFENQTNQQSSNAFIVPSTSSFFPVGCAGGDLDQQGNCRYAFASPGIETCEILCTASSICTGFTYYKNPQDANLFNRCYFREGLLVFRNNNNADAYERVSKLCENI